MSYKCGIGSKTGCLASIATTIITRFFGTMYFISISWKDKIGLYDEECQRIDGFYDSSFRRSYFYFLLVSSIICIVVSVILIFGLKRDKRMHFLPCIIWISFEIICFLSGIIAFIISSVKKTVSKLFISEVFPFAISFLILDIILMIFMIPYYNNLEKKTIIPYYINNNKSNDIELPEKY